MNVTTGTLGTALGLDVGPTVLDVIENALGDLNPDAAHRLGPEEISDLADRLNEFYEAWSMPQVEDGGYSGGWIAGNPSNPEIRQYFFATLLYYPAVLMHDPLADFFDRRAQHLTDLPRLRARQGLTAQQCEASLVRGASYWTAPDRLDRNRRKLHTGLMTLEELAPLIRAGVVVPVPQWRVVLPRQEPVLTGVRHDARDAALAQLVQGVQPLPRSDQIRGLSIGLPWRTSAETRRAMVQDHSYLLSQDHRDRSRSKRPVHPAGGRRLRTVALPGPAWPTAATVSPEATGPAPGTCSRKGLSARVPGPRRGNTRQDPPGQGRLRGLAALTTPRCTAGSKPSRRGGDVRG